MTGFEARIYGVGSNHSTNRATPLPQFKKCFLNAPTPASFLFIFALFKQTIQFLQQMNVKYVMSIQYPAPGFEPTMFVT